MNDWLSALYEVGGGVIAILLVAFVVYVLAALMDRRHYP
jgi:hypothetical protein